MAKSITIATEHQMPSVIDMIIIFLFIAGIYSMNAYLIVLIFEEVSWYTIVRVIFLQHSEKNGA